MTKVTKKKGIQLEDILDETAKESYEEWKNFGKY